MKGQDREDMIIMAVHHWARVERAWALQTIRTRFCRQFILQNTTVPHDEAPEDFQTLQAVLSEEVYHDCMALAPGVGSIRLQRMVRMLTMILGRVSGRLLLLPQPQSSTILFGLWILISVDSF